ncbi:MAG: hypothetical protein K2P92_05735 [Bdellovibrionaceae bacterium]|nr:hypothetical protein [Pseudobdellovibrionaceae bacterium]
MKKIGFITSSADPNLTEDDLLTKPYLLEKGYQLLPVVWDQNPSNLNDYTALVFRSCWNYHVKFSEFQSWLETLKSVEVPIFNSLAISKWNLHKKYLLDFQKKGVSTSFTQLIAQAELNPQLDAFFKNQKQVVLKPAVSLNGHETFLVDVADESAWHAHIATIQKSADVLVQEYLPEIKETGEYSFIFFNGEFSHAVQKLAKSGEFRIHIEHGGRRIAYTPTVDEIKQAKTIVEMIPENLLSVRVDGVIRNGKLILIELEVIDPSLFLENDSLAAQRFTKALLENISTQG